MSTVKMKIYYLYTIYIWTHKYSSVHQFTFQINHPWPKKAQWSCLSVGHRSKWPDAEKGLRNKYIVYLQVMQKGYEQSMSRMNAETVSRKPQNRLSYSHPLPCWSLSKWYHNIRLCIGRNKFGSQIAITLVTT